MNWLSFKSHDKHRRTLHRRLPQRAIRGGESLEARNLLVGETVAFHFEATDLADNEITQVQVGETFRLNVLVEDLRAPSTVDKRGVTQAHLDVTYNQALAMVDAQSLAHGDDFGAFASDTQVVRNDLSTPGVLNEMGSVKQHLLEPAHQLGLGQFLLFSIEFTATNAGQLIFRSNPLDLSGNSVLLESTNSIPQNPEDIIFPSLSLIVTGGGAADAQLNMRVVTTETTLNAQGEAGSLPGNAEWIDEWTSHWAEIWVSTDGLSDSAVNGATVSLDYNTNYFTATEVQAGPAFTVNNSIDDATGLVSLSATVRNGFTPGDDAQALVARVRFTSTANDPGLPVGLDDPSIISPAPDQWLAISPQEEISVVLAGSGSTSNILVGDDPETELWPVMYDLNDSGQIGRDDLSIFTDVFLRTVSTELPRTFANDFDLSGRINFADFSLFGANFGFQRDSAQPRVYLPNFPEPFRPAPLELGAALDGDLVAVDDTITMRKDRGFTVLFVLDNDQSLPDATLTITSIDNQNTIGFASLINGLITYSPMGAFDHLQAGQSATDTLTYTVEDDQGNVSTATVTIVIEGANDRAQYDLTVRREPTAVDANGQIAALPVSEDWLSEWEGFWAELWVTTTQETTAPIASASATIHYDTEYFTATEVTPGPAFRFGDGTDDELSPPSVEDSLGRVAVDAAATTGNLGANHQPVLLARVRLDIDPNDLGIRVDSFGGGPIRPVEAGWIEPTSGSIEVAGEDPTDLIGLQAPPDTMLWPVVFDLNDDQHIGFDDLAIFTGEFLKPVGESSMSYVADFNASGRVGFDDLSIFTANFLLGSHDVATLQYPDGFPENLLAVPLLGEAGESQNLAATELTQQQLDVIVGEATSRIIAALGASVADELANVVVLANDLPAGRLGQATGAIVQIDRNAAGQGWFIDSSPQSNEEFVFDAQMGQWRAISGSAADGRIDLLSTVMHEFGHVLGLEHTERAGDWMHEELSAGVRRDPANEMSIAADESLEYDSSIDEVFRSLGNS
ncbi:MAG: matrixin family metalloprotease [Planctomycetales bacterium]|nr:matrixin family metalloprotease [Planctomycetales bacterium]